MIFSRFIIPLTIILGCSIISGAQDRNDVYRDRSVVSDDSVASREIATPVKKEGERDEAAYLHADTALQINGLAVNTDSVSALKNLKSFGYVKYLDSLLIEKKQSLLNAAATRDNKQSLLSRVFSSSITKYFFWILAGVFVFFILYKLFFTQGIFQRPAVTTNVTVLGDEREHLSQTADYEKLINEAVDNRKYRTAVRYHYLHALQKLSLKEAIQFAADKTNVQYVNELAGKIYQKSFTELTLTYEYVWYGEFEIDEMIFNLIQNKFKQFNKQV